MRKLLERENAALLVIDVQQKLFPLMQQSCEMMHALQKLVKGFQICGRPILTSEQYPKGIGETVGSLLELVGQRHSKTTFSCAADPSFRKLIENTNATQWVLGGLEAHVCVLQTACQLLEMGKEVIVANDAISSRSIYTYSTAIADMRDFGVRIASSESILFELVRDSQAAEFKQISKLVK